MTVTRHPEEDAEVFRGYCYYYGLRVNSFNLSSFRCRMIRLWDKRHSLRGLPIHRDRTPERLRCLPLPALVNGPYWTLIEPLMQGTRCGDAHTSPSLWQEGGSDTTPPPADVL